MQDRREAEQSRAEADAAAEEAVADGERVSAELGEIREAHQVLEETFAAAGRAHAQLVEQLVGEREKATAGEERRGPELPRQPKPASAARAEGVRVVAELRTELAELRQQHREELDTLRVEDRAERDELRAEHREQLADVRAIARTAEQRATEQHQRADRAEALVAPAERPRQ